MTPAEFLLLLISIAFSGAGQFFLKSGALQLGKVTGTNLLSHVLSIATTPALLVGLACYAFGAISYIMLLTRVSLSVAGPAASLIYLVSVLLGYFAFQEAISLSRLVGLGCIVCGVILIAWQR
ncbi:4-amino-4-deoxy-L-arabinose-phosphoundecaprenol flippase subunit ArnE [Acaryochloris thomasi RCC1774]|uniref:4-amino-4-deoxy-L-arabinose-phosphoundecaprenol flippase subunit ArnE n=1 Tax=Acaryochloris thomasi RCC1774 TaxID=1764569 RepID=A0A2W1JK94_9CYAN|nr:EamA family transporter [Acaryochloris thomasi]PZD73646.1 4-amino-4-deoxy-L-arabinose-phosphoundecaprenol flippase subunit ArnE [Acaryochloris thomasi RCC1774]